MLIQLLRATVINGAVWPNGYVVDVDEQLADRLENKGVAEAVDEKEQEVVSPTKSLLKGDELRDILVFVPVYRLEPETVQAVLGLEWDGAISFLFQRDNPMPEQRDQLKRKVMNHYHQYQRGRETFLKGRYDAMLIVESDIIPPADALRRLANVGTDVAYGVYRFRVSDVVNIYERYPEKGGVRARNVGESLSVRTRVFKQALRAGVYPCSGAGFGCILIKRKVLEVIQFRVEYPYNGAYCDTWFTEDVYRAGFSMAADMSVICGHKNENGEILWPRLPKMER